MARAEIMSRLRPPAAAPALVLAVLALAAGPATSQPLERLPVVDRAIAFHGGERFRSSDTELDLCSKSGCFHVRCRIDGDRFVYEVQGTVRDESRHVRWTRDGLEVRSGDKTIDVAPKDEQRWRDWAMERIYFVFLPFRLNDSSVFKEDQGLEDWDGRALHRVKVTFAPGSSTDADDEFVFWFDPETARLEQYAYSFRRDEGGLRFRRLVSPRRVGGILFSDQENLGVNGRKYHVDQITPAFVDESLISISLVHLENVTVSDLDAVAWFFPSSTDAMADTERTLLATPAPAKARAWLARLTEEPHVAGTPQEKKVAELVQRQLADFGLETEIVRYEVFLNHPRHVALRMTEPEEIELALREDFLSVDKDSATRDVFPAFHGYGASGKAEGQVVYVNYGTPDDFARLDELGISPAGRVVLARYGKVFRGLKVREAEKRGAAGVLIYSDPADDGYMKGDIYPDGPMRPPSAIQRGSVQFLSLQPGDPSTPGWPSTDGARRLVREEMTTVPSIPSLPISYGEAEKVLRQLGGPRVPDDWQGGLPFAYHAGPGGASVAMEVEMDEGLLPIYDVFGRIPGSEEPERWVILGNHRDAWTHGAVDPNSGTAAWLETARALAAAVEAGWRPRRTIVLASWDAEEYGLVGSTEWAEERAAELQAKAVAYVNLDAAVTGPQLETGGTPSLRDLVRSAAADVPEPLLGGSVADEWRSRLRSEWAEKAPVELDGPDRPFELHLDSLGSGSDYTVFVDHLGIPSVSFGFRGSYGVYHSVYDNFRWMEKFGDPQFVYHAAAARFFGLLAMRLASAEVVPLRFAGYARALRRELDKLRRETVRQARKGATEDGWDPSRLDFGPVLGALAAFENAGEALDRSLTEVIDREDAAAARRVNERLIVLEQSFLSADGLPGRPWFRHLLYAPGTTTGYAAWPFPELSEAVENQDPDLFDRGTVRVVEALSRATRGLWEAVSSAR